jgi:hypothetical protein
MKTVFDKSYDLFPKDTVKVSVIDSVEFEYLHEQKVKKVRITVEIEE